MNTKSNKVTSTQIKILIKKVSSTDNFFVAVLDQPRNYTDTGCLIKWSQANATPGTSNKGQFFNIF